MSFLKLIIAFAPWLAFLLIAHGSLFRLKLGLIIALVLSIGMGVTRLHRGVILWVGLVFFSCATLVVVVFNNMWAVKHMGIGTSGVLATCSWLTVIFGKPFTMDYAKEHTDRSLWKSPGFIRTNVILTSAWSLTFTINAILAWGKMEHFILSELGYEIISYSLLIGTAAFTSWYPGYVRRRAENIASNASETEVE
jgi:hypothetical protein